LRKPRFHRAETAHRLTQAFLPQPAVGIEHELDGAGIVEGSQEICAEIALELYLCPIVNKVLLFPLIHAQLPRSYFIYDIPNIAFTQYSIYH
jgi:hypothetical protein